VPVQGCTLPYNLYRASVPVQGCTSPYSLYRASVPVQGCSLPYSLYRASVPVQGCTVTFLFMGREDRIHLCRTSALMTIGRSPSSWLRFTCDSLRIDKRHNLCRAPKSGCLASVPKNILLRLQYIVIGSSLGLETGYRKALRGPSQFLQANTFLVSLCLKANADMVPKTPSCYCMLLM
jgi:hypothetical protein